LISEAELKEARVKILQLNQLLAEAEQSEKLHELQDSLLKEEIRKLEMASLRESADLE
jgi:hypothetical protein